MRAIIDGDILRYEVGFAAETGWRAIKGDPEALPPFDYVRDMLNQRIGYIRGATRASYSTIYITEGKTFREDIATVKPYKGTRVENKPWHYPNLTVYLRDVLGAKVVTEIEADDAMAIDHIQSMDETVLCSRDKDLRQVPGPYFSWELGKQPESDFIVDPVGWLNLDTDKKPPKLTGAGYAFFAAQVLMGDSADNIPGLPKYGPVKVNALLSKALGSAVSLATGDIPRYLESLEAVLEREYNLVYGSEAEERLTEQAQLCWMTRRINPDGSPELWRKGLYV